MRRLFIAINLPDNIKEKIEANLRGKIRWLPPENWHLTISFLGYQPDEKIPAILKSIKETAANFKPPKIEFEKTILAPPDKPPRMIWLTAAKETSEKLAAIKNCLDDSLIKNGVRFKIEKRKYNGHLTLARFSTPIRNYENIRNCEKQFIFTAQSLDLMESHLKRAGAKYEILAKVDFSKQT